MILPSGEADAARIGLRLEALGRALDNLPREALRYVRWKNRSRNAAGVQINESRSFQGKASRHATLKPGRPPGALRHGPHTYNPLKFENSPARQIDDILTDLHNMARRVLNGPVTVARPDTS